MISRMITEEYREGRMNKVAYKSVDELEHFRFDDCQIDTFAVTENGVELMVEALIVKADNSQNTNYTESYAGTTKIRITDGKLIRCVRDGYKYYDANDVLQSEVPDYELSVAETTDFPKTCEGAYLFEMKQDADGYVLGIEFVDPEDQTVGNSYQVYVTGTQVAMLWEQYMNRVQN